MQRILILMLFVSLAASAGATTITIVPATSIANASAAENVWISSTFGSNFKADTLETFSEFPASNTTGYNSLSTAVGTFSVAPGSLPGDPAQSNGTKQNQFTILNSADTPFSGRYNTTPSGGNWLDSNDITGLQLSTSLDTLIFMITDVNDCGGTLTIKTADGSTSSAFAPYPTAKDGNLYFVAITSSKPIGDVWWLNNSTNDGFGVDDLGTVVDPPPTSPVPEPASFPLLASVFVAIALATNYKRRQVSESSN